MKTKIFAMLLAAVLVLSLFAGCNKISSSSPTTVTNVTPEEAQEIACKALGITAEEMLSPFIHIGEYGEPAESAYSIQFATLEKDYEFIISAVDGEILFRTDAAEAVAGTGATEDGGAA